jgi:plasmid stability protein
MTTTAVPKRKTSLALPDGLWKRFRIRALEEGRDAQDIVTELLVRYLAKPLSASKRIRRVRPLAEIEEQLRREKGSAK